MAKVRLETSSPFPCPVSSGPWYKSFLQLNCWCRILGYVWLPHSWAICCSTTYANMITLYIWLLMGSSWHSTCIMLLVNSVDLVKQWQCVWSLSLLAFIVTKKRVTDLVIFNSVEQTQQCGSWEQIKNFQRWCKNYASYFPLHSASRHWITVRSARRLTEPFTNKIQEVL